MAKQFTFQEVAFKHENGTKRYAIYLLSNETDCKYTVIFEWGPVGKTGTFEIHEFGSTSAAATLFKNKRREKQGRGYSNVSIDRMVDIKDSAGFAKEIPEVWAALNDSRRRFILAAVRPLDDHSHVDAAINSHAEAAIVERERKNSQDKIDADNARKAREIADNLKINRSWGMF